MNRINPLVCVLAVGIALCPLSLFAQILAPRPGGIPRRTPHAHQTPCWEEAGISKAAMEQRRQIEQNARAQVEAVCAESGLSMQQKRAKIREIHERTRQEVENLITPQQRAALKACQEARSKGGHPGFGGHGGGGMGPCGEMPRTRTPAPENAEPE